MMTVLLTGGIGSGKSTVRHILEEKGVPCYDADFAVKDFYEVPSGSGLRRSGSRGTAKPFLLPEIEKALGRSFRLADGGFDSRALAGAIFGDAARMKTVESIVFPALAADFEVWRAECVSNLSRRAECVCQSDTGPEQPEAPACQLDASWKQTGASREQPGDIQDTSRCEGEAASQTAFRDLPPFIVFESATALDKPDFPKVWDKCLWVDAPEELRIERVTARDRCSRQDVLARLRLQSPLEARRSEVDAALLNDCSLPELRSRTVSALGRLFRQYGF